MNAHETVDPRECIVGISRTATPVERLAARELAGTIGAMTGLTPPVRRDAAEGDGYRLMVGENPLTPGLRRLAEDEVSTERLARRTLLLRGGGPRGALYAVYEWLDRIGCRWFHPEETRLPRLRALPLPGVARVRPGFEYREALWHDAVTHPDWACRNRFNGHLNGLDSAHGGGWGWNPFVHSFHLIAPPATYAVAHPEYYSLRRGQGRVTSGAQLCLSNPDVLRLTVDFALERMANPSTRIVDVSQNDCANPCQCPRCAARDRRAGGHAGSLIDFVDRVAEATVRHHPDKYIGTLAYTYTQTPPRGLQAHPNVIVRLCHMEPSCDVHPLDSCERNRHYVECLRSWTAVAPRVYVWHYVTNFLHYLAFHPNLDALAKDVRFYRDLGVKGVFFQAQRDRGLSFAELHAWCQGRLAWNPDRDYWSEAGEFVDAFYGPGAPSVRRLLDTLHENVRAGTHAHLYTHPSEGTFTSSQLAAADRLLRRAERATPPDSRFAPRVDRLRLWWNYSRLTSVKPIERLPSSFRVHPAPEAPRLFTSIRSRMRGLGPHPLHEFPAGHQDLREELGWSLASRDLPCIELRSPFLCAQVAPELAGMLCTLEDLRTGRDLLCKPAPWMLRYPYIGGYTEGISAGGFGTDFRRAYTVSSQTMNSVVLTAALGGGIRVERRIELDPRASRVHITSTYTHRGRAAVPVQPHGFLLLQLGRLEDIHFYCRRAGGRWEALDNTFPSDGTVSAAQWVSLNGSAVPDGLWAVFDSKLRLGLIQDFGRSRARHCGSNAYLRDQRVMMETLLQPRTVKPGGRCCFRHSLHVIHERPAGRHEMKRPGVERVDARTVRRIAATAQELTIL